MLAGKYKKLDDVPGGHFRISQPRFSPDNFEVNLKLVKELEKIAKQKGCTPAQLAIAWVRSLSEKNGNPVIIPIPGATMEERIVENAKEVALNDQELKEIDSILKSFNVVGGRYGGPQEAHING
jgi:pyridoxine 4-dehydrogenase